MNTFEQPLSFQPSLHSTAPIPPRSSSTIKNQISPSSPSQYPVSSSLSMSSDSVDHPDIYTTSTTTSQETVESTAIQPINGPSPFYTKVNFEIDSIEDDEDEDDSFHELAEVNSDARMYNEQKVFDEVQDQDRQDPNEKNVHLELEPEPEFSAEALIRPVAALMQLDLAGELIYFRDRIADLQEGQLNLELERNALLELERLTEALSNLRKVLTEKQRQLLLLHINDSHRPALQAEVVQLTTECRSMEYQWRTAKETYHRDFVVAAAKAAAEAAAKANAELKAKTENEITVLKTQIASLQRQLDAVAARRAQMMYATQRTTRAFFLGLYTLFSVSASSDASGNILDVNTASFGYDSQMSRTDSRPPQCSGTGFICKSRLIFESGISSGKSRSGSSTNTATSPNPFYYNNRGGSNSRFPGIFGGSMQADQFICPSSDAYAVRIASCPQGDCQQNYCVGGGPAKAPGHLPSGNGLYCGKTLNAQYSGNIDSKKNGMGAFSGDGGGGGGGSRPPHGEYIRNNL
ncbi:hypothetical protein FBU30_001600 [Linnemannia zychae]|nr:hypothetical protein FBU30_001600 [Linnemannia zychae]